MDRPSAPDLALGDTFIRNTTWFADTTVNFRLAASVRR